MSITTNYTNKSEAFIICLDDDKDFLSSLRISLQTTFHDEPNYHVLFQDNPFETLEVIKELVNDREEIALLLTDQMMPNMKGIDFLKEAKQITPNSMRVLLTGYAGMDSAIVAINENLLDKYLTKPVSDFEDLVLTLKRLLREFHLKSTAEAQQRAILQLCEFSNALNSYHSLEEVLEHTVSMTRAALDCERISILLLEEGALRIKAGIGLPTDMTEHLCIPLGKPIAGRVLVNREPMLVKNIDELSWPPTKINADFKSFISAPVVFADLCARDVPLGVINVTNKTGNEPFSQQDLQTLSFIANTASVAITNQLNSQRLEQSYLDTVKALLTALEARDPYTKGHSLRVMEYAEGIAQRLGLGQALIKTIKDAAILHDIGKIGIRDNVLLKPGPLCAAELAEIRKHPEISHAIVQSISSLQEVGLIVRQHHERYDGTGYPDGLQGENIHLGARIMAVADAYDAMTWNRPYRRALTSEIALGEIRRASGTQFDPQCVEAFIRYLNEHKTSEAFEAAWRL